MINGHISTFPLAFSIAYQTAYHLHRPKYSHYGRYQPHLYKILPSFSIYNYRFSMFIPTALRPVQAIRIRHWLHIKCIIWCLPFKFITCASFAMVWSFKFQTTTPIMTPCIYSILNAIQKTKNLYTQPFVRRVNLQNLVLANGPVCPVMLQLLFKTLIYSKLMKWMCVNLMDEIANCFSMAISMTSILTYSGLI